MFENTCFPTTNSGQVSHNFSTLSSLLKLISGQVSSLTLGGMPAVGVQTMPADDFETESADDNTRVEHLATHAPTLVERRRDAMKLGRDVARYVRGVIGDRPQQACTGKTKYWVVLAPAHLKGVYGRLSEVKAGLCESGGAFKDLLLYSFCTKGEAENCLSAFIIEQ